MMNANEVRSFSRWSSPCRDCARCRFDGCGCMAMECDGYITDRETGEIIDRARRVYNSWDSFITCEHVAHRYAEVCEDGELHTNYYIMSDTGAAYTYEYAYDNCYQCADCGDWYEYTDDLRVIDGDHYCDSCAACHSVIGSYHEHKYEYEPIGGTWDDNLIGIEFECDGFDDSDDRENAARAIIDNVSDIVLEEDCSLNNGFEIISQPHTAAALFNGFEFDALVDTLFSWGACECPSTAGLHVHFSRSWFGDDRDEIEETVGRLALAYINNWDMLVSCSGRDDDWHIHEYAAMPTCYEYDTPREAAQNLRSRYLAINNCPSKTVEFRLGAGWVDAAYMRSWIKLHIAMIDACRRGLEFTVNYDYTITITGEQETAAAA